MAKWFLLHDDEVSGPYSEDQVRLDIKSGKVKPSWLIWSKLQDQWRSVSWWQSEVNQLLKNHKETKDNRLWHYASEGQTFGPMTRIQLVQEVTQLKNKSDVLLWTKGMPNWGAIYEFTDLMDEVGVSRRQHPRASLKGTAVIKTAERALLGKVLMISAGGCGINGVDGLIPGEKIHLDIKSPAFSEPLRASAEVRYVTETGFIGLKFTAVSPEYQSKIIEYVRSQTGTNQQKAS